MSNKPKFDPSQPFEEVKPKFDPSQPFQSADHSHDDKGALDAFQKGTEQGVTFGNADEIQGGVGALTDATQALLNKLGIALPSASQANAQLAEQGFKGDIGPQDMGQTYDADRDEARQGYKDAQEQHPIASLAGNIVGGALTSKAAGAFLQPFTAAKDASLLNKVGTGALNAVPSAAILGAGLSEGKDAKSVLNDSIDSTEVGGVIGGTLPLLGAGIKGSVGPIGKAVGPIGNAIEEQFPSVARAYQKGKAGIQTGTQEFTDATNEKLGKLTNTLKEYVLGARNEANKQTEHQINTINSQINNVHDDIQQTIEMTKKASKTIGEVEKNQIENEKTRLANQIQQKVATVKSSLGDTYDKIENQIEGSGITFNMNHPISELGRELGKHMPPSQAAEYVEEFKPYFEKTDLTYPELQQLKILLSDKSTSSNFAIRHAFSTVYKQVNTAIADQLEGNGLSDLAKNLKNTNQKYSAVIDMENSFLDKIKNDRILNKSFVNAGAIETVKDATKADSKNLNSTKEFIEKLLNIDPTAENDVAPQLQSLADRIKAGKSIRPSINMNSPEIKEKLAQLEPLQNELNRLKAGPEVKNQMDALMNSNEKGINDYLGNNLKNVNNPVMEPSRQNIENVLKSYQEASGKNLIPEAQELVKDTELVKKGQEGLAATISPRGLKFGESTLQGPANKAGLLVNKTAKVIEPLKNGISKLSSMANEDMTPLIQKFTGMGSAGQQYAQVLSQAMGKNAVSKNAIMFGLMQDPSFRKMLHNAMGTEDGQ